MQKFHFSLASLFGSIFVAAVGCAALARPTEAWEKTALSMSLGLLFLGLVKLIYGERSRRAFWGGFAIVGWGYLLVISLIAPFQGTREPQLATSALLQMLARVTLGGDPLTPYSSLAVSGYDPYAPDPYAPRSVVPVASSSSPTEQPPIAVVSPTEIPPLLPPPHATDDPTAPVYEPADAETIANSGLPATGYYGTPVVAITMDPGAWMRFMQIGQYLWAIVLGSVGGLLASCIQARTARLESKAPAGDKPAAGG